MNTEHIDTKQKNNNKEIKHKPRRPLVFDVDDVILNTGETIVEIINSKYDLNPKLSVDGIKDWNFTYFKREIKKQKGIELFTIDFLNIFESEEFWNKVTIKQSFLDILYEPAIRDDFMVSFVSTGTKRNLELKEKYLFEHLNMRDVRFVGIPVNSEKPCFAKKDINDYISLRGGIQVDDNYECLDSNAKLKILLKNNKDTSYNQVVDIREDLYVVNDLNDLKDILLFIINANNEFFEDFKSIPFVW